MKSRYGMEIRAAGAAEAPGLAELLGIAPRLLAERLDAVRHGAGTALIAVEWGPPSGVVVLHWYRTLDADHPVAQITNLYVGAENRRRGVGRMLLKAAAQAARVAGCGALEINVGADNPALLAFCGATGFTQTGSRFERPLRKGG